jgi:hypothetical protein
MSRPTALLASPARIPSPQIAVHFANNRFSTPFFSISSELLFQQLLCFHNHLRCPLLFPTAATKLRATSRSTLLHPSPTGHESSISGPRVTPHRSPVSSDEFVLALRQP